MTTQRYRDARRYYAAQYWHYRTRARAMCTEGARLAFLGRAAMYRALWLVVRKKRGSM